MPETCHLDIPNVAPTPEFLLFTACAWTAPDDFENLQSSTIRSACTRNVNWRAFLSLVCVHGVQPQVYEALRRYGEGVPGEILGKLRDLRVRGSAQALQQGAELVRLSRVFTAEGIDLLPLKGVALSQQLYGDPGMRISGDLDVMVKGDQLDRACRILEREGYQCELHGVVLTRRQRDHIRKNLYHLEFRNETRGICLELHWSIGALWLPEHTELLWRHVRSREWGGSPIGFLDEDILLLVLCDHGARHRFCCLKWLGDVARLLAVRTPSDWAHLVRLAELLDLKRTLAHAALLVHWVFGLPLRDGLVRLITEDPVAIGLSRKVYGLFTLPAEATAAQRRGGPWLSLQLQRLRPSIPLARVLRSSLIAPTDFLYVQLPEPLFWLYCPMRPLMWAWRYWTR